jgi:hypothetical protein
MNEKDHGLILLSSWLALSKKAPFYILLVQHSTEEMYPRRPTVDMYFVQKVSKQIDLYLAASSMWAIMLSIVVRVVLVASQNRSIPDWSIRDL